MTSARLLMLVRELSPSSFSDSMIMMWISEIEYALATDISEVDPSRLVEMTEPTQEPMLIPHPFDRVYLPYVQAMVANAQGETDLYQNYIAKFNAYRDEWAQWVLNGRQRRNAYYIDAYQLAREHGYEGTIEQWLDSLKGEKGDKGDGVLIKGHYDTLEQLRQAHPVGYLGDYYEVGLSQDDAVVYYWDSVAHEWHGIDIVDGQRKAREAAEEAADGAQAAGQAMSAAFGAAQAAALSATQAGRAERNALAHSQDAQDAARRAETAADAAEELSAATKDISAGYEEARTSRPILTPGEYMMEQDDGTYRIKADNGNDVFIGRAVTVDGSHFLELSEFYGGQEYIRRFYVDGYVKLEIGITTQDYPVRINPMEIVNEITTAANMIRDLDTRVTALESAVLNSWSGVQALVRQGVIGRYLGIGDQLQCGWNGNVLTWDVVGIDADVPADSSLTHSLTLMLSTCVPGVTKATGSAVWKKSALREYLNSTDSDGFRAGLDEDFDRVIGEVIKPTALVADSAFVLPPETNAERYFLPSCREVGITGAPNEEGIKVGNVYQPYQPFVGLSGTAASKKRVRTLNGADNQWVLRSRTLDSYSYGVGTSGERSYWVSTAAVRGVVPMCCIV